MLASIKRRAGLLALSLYWGGVSMAQSDQQVEVSGFAELDHISYFHQQAGKVNARNQGIIQLELEGSHKSLSYFGAIEFRNDMADPARNRLWIDELYLSYRAKNYDLVLGKKIHTWGSTDGFSPVNVINPTDYSDMLDTDDETIGVYSASLKYYLGNHYVESVFVPVFQPSVIPQADSRWYPTQPSVAPVGDGVVPVRYSLLAPEPVPRDIRSFQVATRLGGYVGAVDYNVNYYHGYDDIPYFYQYPELQDDTLQMGLQQRYHKMQLVGVDLSAVVGGLVLKGEYAYIHQRAPEGQDWYMGAPYHYAVAGLDKNVIDVVGEVDVLLTAQFIYQHIVTSYEVSSFYFNHIFQRALMLRAAIDFTNRLNLETTAIYDFHEGHYVVMPELTYAPQGGLNISLKSYLTGGQEESLFGSYANNRLQLLARYYF
ncbi:hypothetical protein [Marinoscillum furvescens]|uniref:Porin n=1 Tax=Marinoscillum furvescens DSM 4134 TaxID=1122208 RepID=A0A3D9KX26_MARFU|nr:hypothetical protein [Marinoscillum furvescens]RED93027.1 hypothetical protein C7460_12751 [Marinoscillum furvescens DSM 4134]